jgi:hypothetical protein
MEVIQNRYGQDRVIEKISPTEIRVMGESLFARTSESESGELTMFDFEGGPSLYVGGSIRYLKSDWTITKIKRQENILNLICVLLEVKLNG